MKKALVSLIAVSVFSGFAAQAMEAEKRGNIRDLAVVTRYSQQLGPLVQGANFTEGSEPMPIAHFQHQGGNNFLLSLQDTRVSSTPSGRGAACHFSNVPVQMVSLDDDGPGTTKRFYGSGMIEKNCRVEVRLDSTLSTTFTIERGGVVPNKVGCEAICAPLSNMAEYRLYVMDKAQNVKAREATYAPGYWQ